MTLGRGAFARFALLLTLAVTVLAACGDDPLDLNSLDPGDCVQADGLEAGFFVTWDSLSQVSCDEEHNGTVIGDSGDGERCEDVFELYRAEVEVPDGAVVTGVVGNCTVFSETGTVVGNLSLIHI